jgi:hypothetical protein
MTPIIILLTDDEHSQFLVQRAVTRHIQTFIFRAYCQSIITAVQYTARIISDCWTSTNKQ